MERRTRPPRAGALALARPTRAGLFAVGLAAGLIASAALTCAPALARSDDTPAPEASAPKGVGITITGYGIYAVHITGYTSAPRDVAGQRFNASQVRLIRKTRTILAQPSLTFGFSYEITDPALIGKRLRMVLTFPRMTNPRTGRSGDQLDDVFVALPGAHHELFRFDYTWEMAEGIWTYRIYDGDKVIAELKFKVVVAIN